MTLAFDTPGGQIGRPAFSRRRAFVRRAHSEENCNMGSSFSGAGAAGTIKDTGGVQPLPAESAKEKVPAEQSTEPQAS
jgi:hypothetical protein